MATPPLYLSVHEMICPKRPLLVELPLISTLSVGMYWTPCRTRLPVPAMLIDLFFRASQPDGSMKGADAGTKQVGSFRTRTLISRGGVGELGPLVWTNWPCQSIAAVAAVPPEYVAGNLVPALSAMTSALFPLTMQVFWHSSNMRATPGDPGSYPPISEPPTSRPFFR